MSLSTHVVPAPDEEIGFSQYPTLLEQLLLILLFVVELCSPQEEMAFDAILLCVSDIV